MRGSLTEELTSLIGVAGLANDAPSGQIPDEKFVEICLSRVFSRRWTVYLSPDVESSAARILKDFANDGEMRLVI